MSTFEDLDAFKACHQLTLAVHRITETLETRDAELAGQLWTASLVASSRIARGSGFRHRRMFALCVDRTLAALAEISYHLEMARTMDLITEEDHRELESLGGRAVFYSMKLAMSLEPDPAAGAEPPKG
jgi:four helix bundle protein